MPRVPFSLDRHSVETFSGQARKKTAQRSETKDLQMLTADWRMTCLHAYKSKQQLGALNLFGF